MESATEGLSPQESQLIAVTIREALARRRISRQTLADDAKISISTLEKALSGRRPFTLSTIIRLEQALNLSLRAVPTPPPAAREQLAADEFGSYARTAVRWIEGCYLTLRPSFGERGSIYAYRTEIAWDDHQSCLTFHEADRLDTAFTQSGTVAVPTQSGHIYLVTNRHGQHRLAVLSRPTIAQEMYGILTTLQAGRGSHLTPVATPLALVFLDPVTPVAAEFGRVREDHPIHALYRRHLDRVTGDGYALFVDR